MNNVKLGKKAPKNDPRTLHLADYLRTDTLPTIPARFDWSDKVPSWPMMGNDRLGDCTVASCGHMIEAWTANAGTEVTPSDADIIAAYSAITGYDPSTGANDDGAVEIDVLNYWRKTGIAGRQITAYAALEPRNHQHVKASVYLFGGCYIGLALPLSAQSQKVWSVPLWGKIGNGAPNSWGGHAVPIVSYDKHGLTVVTWGALQRMTWNFLNCYCDESYAVLSQDFINNGVAPNSIDLTSLQQDLSKL